MSNGNGTSPSVVARGGAGVRKEIEDGKTLCTRPVPAEIEKKKGNNGNDKDEAICF